MSGKKDNTAKWKLGFISVGLLGVLLTGSVAQAVPITFTDHHNVSGILGVFISSSNPTYSYQHLLAGFNPASDTLTNASLGLRFLDDLDPRQAETAYLTFNGTPGAAFTVPNFALRNLFGGTVSTAVSVSTLSTGLLNVTLSRVSGDFFFLHSTLAANGDRSSPPPAPAPEPGTLLLLGSGLAGLGLWRRKRAKRVST